MRQCGAVWKERPGGPIYQYLQQHLRMVTGSPTPLILRQQGAEVDPLDGIIYNPHQVFFLYQLVITGGQQVRLTHHIRLEYGGSWFLCFYYPIESRISKKVKGCQLLFDSPFTAFYSKISDKLC